MNTPKLTNIPRLAKGTDMPASLAMLEMKKAEERALRKKQYRHDWLIALFGVLGGSVAGFLTSLIFWLIGK